MQILPRLRRMSRPAFTAGIRQVARRRLRQAQDVVAACPRHDLIIRFGHAAGQGSHGDAGDPEALHRSLTFGIGMPQLKHRKMLRRDTSGITLQPVREFVCPASKGAALDPCYFNNWV